MVSAAAPTQATVVIGGGFGGISAIQDMNIAVVAKTQCVLLNPGGSEVIAFRSGGHQQLPCLLYTSDAADE